MTLQEIMGSLCALIGSISGVFISLSYGLGLWTILIGICSFLICWCIGAVPITMIIMQLQSNDDKENE